MSQAKSDEPMFRTSPLLLAAGFRHAFFTRHGGVSEGPFSSLNFSVAVGDHGMAVAKNVQLAAARLGVAAERVYFLSQVHGDASHVVRGDEERDDVLRWEGDALVSLNPACAAGIRTADCLPILVGDRRSGGALAIHAGWKGIVAGVVGKGIARLREAIDDEGDLVAAIGPHITERAFEVSEDVARTLANCVPGSDVVITSPGKRPHVALARIARAQLLSEGLALEDVDVVPGCTYSDPTEFYSFRRDGARSGRHLSAIVAKGPSVSSRRPVD